MTNEEKAEVARVTRRRDICRIAELPLCPDHGNTMGCGSSQGAVAYYYCRVATCSHAKKVERLFPSK